MAFFDDLGKKISQAGQSVAQKTKELADITRINSLISDEERRMDDNYREIGKLYVSTRGGNPDVDFAPLVAAIHESGDKIVEYRQQVKDIKGVVCCEKCGAEIPNSAAFCSSCGAPMPVVKPVENQPEKSPAQAWPEAEGGDAGQAQAADESTQTADEGTQTADEGTQAADEGARSGGTY